MFEVLFEAFCFSGLFSTGPVGVRGTPRLFHQLESGYVEYFFGVLGLISPWSPTIALIDLFDISYTVPKHLKPILAFQIFSREPLCLTKAGIFSLIA